MFMSYKVVFGKSFSICRISVAGSLDANRSNLRHKTMYCGLRLSFFAALGICLFMGSMTAAHNSSKLVLHKTQEKLLEPGKSYEGKLAKGESNSYLIKLVSGQFLHAIIEQRTMDLTA